MLFLPRFNNSYCIDAVLETCRARHDFFVSQATSTIFFEKNLKEMLIRENRPNALD